LGSGFSDGGSLISVEGNFKLIQAYLRRVIGQSKNVSRSSLPPSFISLRTLPAIRARSQPAVLFMSTLDGIQVIDENDIFFNTIQCGVTVADM
jgi:hypothetical protein